MSSPAAAPKTRTSLNGKDLLIFAQMAVGYQDEYCYGQMGKFWKKMRALLQQKIQKDLKDPGSTMDVLVSKRRIAVTQEVESGTVQRSDDMTQAVDQWIQRLDFLVRQKEDSKKTTGELDTEKQKAQTKRSNSRLCLADKQDIMINASTSEHEQLEDTNQDNINPTIYNNKSTKRTYAPSNEESERPHKKREIQADRATVQLTEAIGEMGTRIESVGKNIAQAIRDVFVTVPEADGDRPRIEDISTRLNLVEAEQTRQGIEQTKQGNMLKEILKAILNKEQQGGAQGSVSGSGSGSENLV